MVVGIIKLLGGTSLRRPIQTLQLPYKTAKNKVCNAKNFKEMWLSAS